jgi:HEAT repeat protein
MRLSPGDKLRTLAQSRLGPRLERLINSALGVRVQRLGQQALRRAAARFPILADLIGLRREMQHQVSVSAFGSRPPPRDTEFTALDRPLETLLARVTREASWQVRAEAASSLASAEGEDVVETLLRAMHDPSAEVAAAAIETLSRKDDARIAPAFARVFDNREGYYSPVTRASAVLGLGRLLGESSIDTLGRALSDVDAEVSLAAIAAIGEHVPVQAAEHLVPLIEDRTGYFLPLVRLSAVHGLARLGALSHYDAVRLRRVERDDTVRSALESVVVGSFRA